MIQAHKKYSGDYCMRNTFNEIKLVLILGFIISGVLLSSGQPVAEAVEKVGLKVMVKEGVGKYLSDGQGMTLYRFTKDEMNNSHCIEGCAVNWPPFYIDPAAVEDGLEPSYFAVITRTDSRQQTTYKGMPLYYFKNDKFPGDTFGDGIGDVWYLVTP
jgi:predicted lipoprotein with Yx(FWY)xxD motif